MKAPPPLPLPDYERIFQVIYSVFEASEVVRTHRACMLFSLAGRLVLQEYYKLPATICAGFMGMRVDEKNLTVVSYGRMGNGPESDREAFHAWVECRGWLIDFMAPIMGKAYEEDGHKLNLPRRMLQKPLDDRKSNFYLLHRVGDFYLSPNPALAESLIDSQPAITNDLAKVCVSWYRRPPEALRELNIADSHGMLKKLVLRAPSVEGVW